LILRTIVPHDAERLQDYVHGLSSESRRNRFLGALAEFTPTRLNGLTRMHGPGNVVLLALAQIGRKLQMVAEAMLVIAPNGERGEIALSVADQWQRRGLGTVLIRDLGHRRQRFVCSATVPWACFSSCLRQSMFARRRKVFHDLDEARIRERAAHRVAALTSEVFHCRIGAQHVTKQDAGARALHQLLFPNAERAA
jgi:hypothetical protein